MKCPKCNSEVIIKKNSILKCICNSSIMLIEINKKEMLIDVTPNKEVEKSEYEN